MQTNNSPDSSSSNNSSNNSQSSKNNINNLRMVSILAESLHVNHLDFNERIDDLNPESVFKAAQTARQQDSSK